MYFDNVASPFCVLSNIKLKCERLYHAKFHPELFAVLCRTLMQVVADIFFTAPACLTISGEGRWKRGLCNCVSYYKSLPLHLGWGNLCMRACAYVCASSHYAPTCSALLVSGVGAPCSD